jgi:hypothetical protein
MKKAHLFRFCRKLPEPARCLIELRVCGTPIVGYGSTYAQDLVSTDGGGHFVNVVDIEGLPIGSLRSTGIVLVWRA